MMIVDPEAAHSDGSTPLRRSLLFVPGDDPRKLERSEATGADTLIFDLEDSVAPDWKERARARVAGRLASDGTEHDYVVRVNGSDTPQFERDVSEMVECGVRSLMLPKCRPASLGRARCWLATVEQRLGLEAGCIRLLGLVETAAGIVSLPRLLNEPARLDALCFGNADFSLDMELAEGDLSTGVVYHARCSLSIAAAATGVAAIDGVCLRVHDIDAFEAEARTAANLGFSGKLCIHPDQVPIANDVFTPTPEQTAHARRVVEAGRRQSRSGRDVFSLDGKMVDTPVLKLQQRLLARARRAGALDAESAEPHD
jgi:citrate lyase subunit beta/citryl-CoA lyase